MGDTKIELAQKVWNPMAGCSKVSPGCDNCYAERMAKRLSAMAKAARGRGGSPGKLACYERALTSRGRWSGHVALNWDALEDPCAWRTPKVVFVNSMSDLFHESVPLDFIKAVFAVMNKTPRHAFLVLTKRPERAAALSGGLAWSPNIWMGATVESEGVLSRAEALRATGASARFLTCEPLLGPLPNLDLAGIEWVVAGGETGPRARPMDPEWARGLQRKCQANAVKFFFKQWGGASKKRAGRLLDGRACDEMPDFLGFGPQGPEAVKQLTSC